MRTWEKWYWGIIIAWGIFGAIGLYNKGEKGVGEIVVGFFGFLLIFGLIPWLIIRFIVGNKEEK